LNAIVVKIVLQGFFNNIAIDAHNFRMLAKIVLVILKISSGGPPAAIILAFF